MFLTGSGSWWESDQQKKLGSQKYFKISVRYTEIGNWHTNIWNSSVENFLNPCVRIFLKSVIAMSYVPISGKKGTDPTGSGSATFSVCKRDVFVVNPAYLALAGTFKLSSIMYS